jgi:class 3 adenylate cyclase
VAADDVPVVRYAEAGGVHVAYQVVGDGPIDVVVVPAWASNVEVYWESPLAARLNWRLASFGRLIMFDKRGTGLSDRPGTAATLETRMDDVRAVMDAADSERAALIGFWEGGPMSALFAATHPDRVTALVLYGSMAALTASSDYPWAPSAAENEATALAVASGWGEGRSVDLVAPSLASDTVFKRWWARLERHSISPGDAAQMYRLNSRIDVRAVLQSVRVPTLVLHRTGDPAVPVGAGRHLAREIPGARFRELPGGDHLPFVGDQRRFADEIEEFLTGVPPVAAPERVLATVLFTDIVGSTERAASLGDEAWRDLLEAHRSVVRRLLVRFRGREIDTTGDGFFATFDGPTRAILCALAVRDSVQELGLQVRCALHTGEIDVEGDRVTGIAIHIGARLLALAGPSEAVVSSTVKELVVGSGIQFADRGTHQLKGIPDPWHAFVVV